MCFLFYLFRTSITTTTYNFDCRVLPPKHELADVEQVAEEPQDGDPVQVDQQPEAAQPEPGQAEPVQPEPGQAEPAHEPAEPPQHVPAEPPQDEQQVDQEITSEATSEATSEVTTEGTTEGTTKELPRNGNKDQDVSDKYSRRKKNPFIMVEPEEDGKEIDRNSLLFR